MLENSGMGREKAKMELIQKRGQRLLTFNKRKESLKKKLDQLKILCDVDACIIIYGPDHPEIHPPNQSSCQRLIHLYKSKRPDCKTYGLPDFFEERQKRAHEELARLKKGNLEAKYPPWHKKLDEEKDPLVLRDFARKLKIKAELVRAKIRERKGENLIMSNNNDLMIQYPANLNDMASSFLGNMCPPPPVMIGGYNQTPYYADLMNNVIPYVPQPCINFPMADPNVGYGIGEYLLPDANISTSELYGGGGCLLPPQAPVVVDVSEESQGDYIPEEPFMMLNEEGSEYLIFPSDN